MSRAIDRRRFLQVCAPAAALAAGPAVSARQTPASGSSDQIVIVGAGLAGLRAAEVLRTAGRRVLVLEARGSSGGRVRTVRTFDEGLYAEAGAIRIPALHKRVLGLASELQLAVVPFWSSAGASLVSIGDKSWRMPDELAALAAPLNLRPDEVKLAPSALLRKYVADLPPDIADAAPQPDAYARWAAFDEASWPDWLRSRGASAGAVKLMTLGGDSSGLSALYVLRQFVLLQKAGDFYKIQGGMDQLPRRMAAALGDAVRYNAAVVRLDQRTAPIRIDYLQNGQTRSVRADRAIVTIPFSTLRHVEVLPSFSAPKARIVQELPYFPATRLLLQTRRRFWHDLSLSGSARTDDGLEVWDAAYDSPAARGMLAATVGGSTGEALTGLSQPQALKMGTALVVKPFPALAKAFERGAVYRWMRDPWSRGAFAGFRPGQMASMMPEVSRPEGRVHFAGEHTSSWMGWMEGALESGERAASEILQATA
jgi:monoamine oxidase